MLGECHKLGGMKSEGGSYVLEWGIFVLKDLEFNACVWREKGGGGRGKIAKMCGPTFLAKSASFGGTGTRPEEFRLRSGPGLELLSPEKLPTFWSPRVAAAGLTTAFDCLGSSPCFKVSR